MAKGGKVGQVAVWVLLAMLIVGLAGFGITNYGGSIRKIGSVGGQDISTSDYARALQREIDLLSEQSGRRITPEEAASFGLDRITLQRLVTTAALDDAATRIGLSIGDERLAAEIRGMPAFRDAQGSFSRETYTFALERGGYDEGEFESRLRADIARGVLQSAIAGGVVAPAGLVDLYYRYISERRAFTLLVLGESDLTEPLSEPDDAAVRAHYDATPERYTAPEIRRIRHAVMLPERMIDEVEIDPATIRAAYDERIDEFRTPERRLVERLAFPDEAAANAAKADLDAGATTFEALVESRALTLSDVDLGDVGPEDLGAAAEAVFAAEAPAIVGPLPSLLGPALFRVNGVLAAEETSFEEAEPQLRAELATDAARRLIADRIESIDDLLAGGVSITDLATEAGMDVAESDLTAQSVEGLAAYPEFRERALAVTAEDFPALFQLDDGGIAALELVEVIPPQLRPFEEVAEEARAATRAEALAVALAARRDAILAEVEAGAAMGAFGVVTVNPGLNRGGMVEGAPASLGETIFAMAPGALRGVDAPGFTGLLRLDAVIAGEISDAEESAAIREVLADRLGQEMQQDVFELFARALEGAAEIRLDDAAIRAVGTQMR
jgi:peptidyl-prolyl cis-trans isomerase D